MPVYPATMINGRPRPAVPIEIAYQCPSCNGAPHQGEAVAILDTGASHCFAGAAILPPGHVAWDQLVPVQERFNHGNERRLRVGLWRVQLSVLGVPVTEEVLVTEPHDGGSSLDYFMLGLPAFSRLYVAFAWSNVPPAFVVEPVGQLPGLVGLEILPEPAFGATYTLPEPDPERLALKA